MSGKRGAKRPASAQLDLLGALMPATLPAPPPELLAAPVEQPAPLPEPELTAPAAEPPAPEQTPRRARLTTADVLDDAALTATLGALRARTMSAAYDMRAPAKTSTMKQGDAAVRALDARVREMPAGWARGLVVEFDDHVWGRWSWWLCCAAFGRIVEGPIPQIDIAGSARSEGCNKVMAHLWWCVDQIAYGNRRAALLYLIDWTAWALGVGGDPAKMPCPSPSYVHPLAAAMLYELVDLCMLQLWPADYFGEMLCEFAHGQGKGETAFFPTPMDLCTLMASMTYGRPVESAEELEERKRSTAYDPAVGTGRTLLAASNYCLRMYAQDIDALVLRVTHINLFLYAPWGAMPLPHLFDASIPEPIALTFGRLKGIVELSLRLGEQERGAEGGARHTAREV